MNKQSFDSEKFSKDGITITTANPIYYNIIPESPADWYLSFDQSNSEDVKAFQKWVQENIKSDIIDFYGQSTQRWFRGVDARDGVMLGKTLSAWNTYGNQYLASLNTTNAQPATQPTDSASLNTTNAQHATQPTDDQIAAAKKSGLTWDKVNKKWQQLEQSGAVDTLLGLFGLCKKSDTTPTADDNKLKNPDKPMSTGAKIAIGVGAAAVLAIIIYTATKKSK